MNGFTAQPSFDEEGNYQGVEVSSGRQELNRQGLAPAGFQHDELTGETALFTEASPEQQMQNDYDAVYVEAILEANPEIPDALEYLINSGVWSPERQAEHDKAINSDSYDVLNEAIEKMLNEYREFKTLDEQQPNSAPVDEDEDADIPNLEHLYEAEPDADSADVWADYATQTEGATSLIAELTSRFHNGDTNVDGLVEEALSSDFSRDELLAAYNYLSGGK